MKACIGINRILIQDSIYDKFLSDFAQMVSQIKVGYGLEDGVTLGPLVNERSITKVRARNDCLAFTGNVVVVLRKC